MISGYSGAIRYVSCMKVGSDQWVISKRNPTPSRNTPLRRCTLARSLLRAE